ncbi:MAG: MlaD family protein [Candidatus Sedimenticola sp. (ex Thyasira tokunagai)]
MKRQNLSYLSVGFFVLAMLIGLMLMLAKISGRTGPVDHYTVAYDNVSGLSKGTPITYEGYSIGRIAGIKPQHRETATRYLLQLEVQKGWPIPDDSIARIVSSGLLSTINIDISGGKSSKLLSPGSSIVGRESVSLFAALDTIAGDVNHLTKEGFIPLLNNINSHIDAIATPVEADAAAILAHLKSSAGKLDSGMDRIFNDIQKLTQQLNSSATDLRQVVGEKNRKSLSGFLETMEGGANDMRRMVGKENRASLSRFLGSMEESATNFARLSGDLEKSRQQLNQLLSESQGVVSDNRQEIKQAVTDLKASLQIVSQHISSVSYNLEDTSRNMAEFSRQIRQNPGLLLSGSPPPDSAK